MNCYDITGASSSVLVENVIISSALISQQPQIHLNEMFTRMIRLCASIKYQKYI